MKITCMQYRNASSFSKEITSKLNQRTDSKHEYTELQVQKC